MQTICFTPAMIALPSLSKQGFLDTSPSRNKPSRMGLFTADKMSNVSTNCFVNLIIFMRNNSNWKITNHVEYIASCIIHALLCTTKRGSIKLIDEEAEIEATGSRLYYERLLRFLTSVFFAVPF